MCYHSDAPHLIVFSCIVFEPLCVLYHRKLLCVYHAYRTDILPFGPAESHCSVISSLFLVDVGVCDIFLPSCKLRFFADHGSLHWTEGCTTGTHSRLGCTETTEEAQDRPSTNTRDEAQERLHTDRQEEARIDHTQTQKISEKYDGVQISFSPILSQILSAFPQGSYGPKLDSRSNCTHDQHY